MKAYMILRGKCHTKRSEIHSVKVYLKSVLLSKTLCLSHITLNVFVPRIHKYILVFFIFVTCFPDRTVKILEGNWLTTDLRKISEISVDFVRKKKLPHSLGEIGIACVAGRKIISNIYNAPLLSIDFFQLLSLTLHGWLLLAIFSTFFVFHIICSAQCFYRTIQMRFNLITPLKAQKHFKKPTEKALWKKPGFFLFETKCVILGQRLETSTKQHSEADRLTKT